MLSINISELATLTAHLPIIDRQVFQTDNHYSAVYELYRKGNGFLLVTYPQNFSGAAEWGEFSSAERALNNVPVEVAERMRRNVRSVS